MGDLPDDYLDFKLAIKLGMDPDELDKKPLDKVELWQRYLDEDRRAANLKANRNNQANGE